MPDDLPYLRFGNPDPLVIPERKKRSGGMQMPSRQDQWERLEPELKNLQESLERRTLELSETAPGAAAEDVLVFELAGGVDDFFKAVRDTPGMEWLADTEDELPMEEAAGFARLDKDKHPDPTKDVKEHVYMVASNAAALRELLTAWERKSQGLPLKGNFSKFGNVFLHVIKIRRWGWQDRLREEELDLWGEIIEQGAASLCFEIELWFRRTEQARRKAEVILRADIEALGGRVIRPFEHEGCGYHGLCVELPADRVKELLANRKTAKLFQEESVLHFWLTGQSVAPGSAEDGGEDASEVDYPLPSGSPEVAIFDGMPIENHPLLVGRLLIDDPDGISEDYPVQARNHGTQMASLIVCGDLARNETRLSRPLYVRLIMHGVSLGDGKWDERVPAEALPLDLLQRAVIRLKEVVPSVKVVNLSIGDQARPFLGSPSAWARMLDWLQVEYDLLFIVSAGNRKQLPSPYDSMTAFEGAEPEELEKAIMESLIADNRARRLLSPAESINAVTVGASHRDSGGALSHLPPGARVGIRLGDLPSPISCMGPGHRKAVKPDILLDGGRQLLRLKSVPDRTLLEAVETTLSPGIKVAAPPLAGQTSRTVYSRGTSVAAALATRRCALAFDALRGMTESDHPGEEFFSVLAKALSIHPACWCDADGYLQDLLDRTPGKKWSEWRRKMLTPLLGHGIVAYDDLMLGRTHRVTLLSWGEITVDQTLEFKFPLPSAVDGGKGLKRLTSTVAWFSPIHPGHARYRKAKLTLLPPNGAQKNQLGIERRNGEFNQLSLGTVHHEVFEGHLARGLTEDDLPLHLTCRADAAELDSPVRYGLAVTLEVAPNLFNEIYTEVRNKLAVPVGVRP